MDSWIPLLVAFVAAAPGVISLWRGRRKQTEEEGNLHVQTADTLVENLREDNRIVRAQLDAAKTDKEVYRTYAKRLHAQLREHDIEPVVSMREINQNGATKPSP